MILHGALPWLLYWWTLTRPPDMMGLATYYVAPVGAETRSGEGYRPDALACAVDDSEWARLRGKRLLVRSGSRWLTCRVNDTGYLYRAGTFRRGIWRWLPAEDGFHVVVDIPVETHKRLEPHNDTVLVSVWILEETWRWNTTSTDYSNEWSRGLRRRRMLAYWLPF